MKIFEIDEHRLRLVPDSANTIKCEKCKGTGRYKGFMCDKCKGKSNILPLFQTTTDEFKIIKNLLGFKLTNFNGIIFQKQIPDIRRSILKFNNINSADPAKENIIKKIKVFDQFLDNIQKIKANVKILDA